VRRGSRNREAVPKRDRCSRLQTRHLDHPGRPRKVRCQRGTKISQRLVSGPLALVTRYSVIDLHEVDPAHHRASRKRVLNPGERRLLAIQPGKDCPGIQTDAHLGSRARSSSRRAAIPVFANRPPSCRGDRRATSTISSSRNSKSTSSPGCKRARSRNAFGITTCPLAPIRPVIPDEYNKPARSHVRAFEQPPRPSQKRRGRDSNSRYTNQAHNGFRDRRIQPLCHPSRATAPKGIDQQRRVRGTL
jgi:hypothetical protein